MNVAILGASAKPERYSYLAVQKLLQAGHAVFPIHPKLQFILGQRVYPELAQLSEPIDTLTLYVGAEGTNRILENILALKPRRIIFNPGAENDILRDLASAAGIETLYACTLVLLSTNQF